jgi:hypothetical protein
MKNSLSQYAVAGAIGLGTLATAINAWDTRVEASGFFCCGTDACRITAQDRPCWTADCPGGGFNECCHWDAHCHWGC